MREVVVAMREREVREEARGRRMRMRAIRSRMASRMGLRRGVA